MSDLIETPGDSPDGDEGDDIDLSAADQPGAAADPEGDDVDLPDLPGANDQLSIHTSFLEYLQSPIVELAVSPGVTITAHRQLLCQSPYFMQACSNTPASPLTQRLDLPDVDIEALGSFIEYLYRGDYFPRNIGDRLETHPSIPDVDVDGDYLLKHARVYNLAHKFDMPALKSLAHKKIQKTTSTARGEIAYARYVYATTSSNDAAIRRPVAVFWGTRSHVLRHEAEEEFRAMCLDFPQFGFDVLSTVLDQKEKRTGGGGGGRESGGISVGVETPGTGRGKKRARNF